jgi:hypothetical protein
LPERILSKNKFEFTTYTSNFQITFTKSYLINIQMLHKIKTLSLWVALFGFLLAAPLSSCGNKKEKDSAEHPTDEHPTDADEHPSDGDEHPN